MKTSGSILKLSLVVTISLGFSSCSLTYNLKNKDEIVKDIGYPSGKLPFQMVTSDLMAPSFSKKGQVYADGSIGNGIGTGVAWAVSNRSFITGHCNYHFNQNSLSPGSTYVEADYEWLNYDGYYGWTSGSGDTAGIFKFTRKHEVQSSNLEFGYGQFKELEKQLRNEWIVGTGTGKTSNVYSYTMLSNTINFTEKRRFVNFYFQDDFAWVHKHFEATVIGRFNTYFFTNRTLEMDFLHQAPDYQRTAFSMEGAFRLSTGFKSVKAYVQITGSAPIASPEIEWTPVQFKAGVMMRFGKSN